MRVYLIVFIVTLLIQFIPVRGDRGYLKRVICTFLPLFLFGALRVDFGLDYPTYEAEFNWAHSGVGISDISEHSEIGYIIFEKIIPEWRLLLIITSALTCISYCVVFYKCIPPKYSWLAICLLFLAGDKTVFFQFSGIRNAIVIAIMYLSLAIIRDRRWVVFILLTGLAMTMHTSAVLMMPVVFFLCSSKDMTKREAVIWVVVMFILQVISLNTLFEQVTDAVGAYLDRYSSYAQIAEERGDQRSFILRVFAAGFTVMIVWFMCTTKLSREENVICRISLLFIMSFLLGALNMRMPQYYGFAFVCGSTIVISKWRESFAKITYTALTFIFLCYSFFIVWLSRPEMPYRIYYSIFG